MKKTSVVCLVFLIVTLGSSLFIFDVPIVKAEEPSEGWVNRYTYDIDYGNFTHTSITYIGPQAFDDSGVWRELKFEDHYISDGYFLIENSHICAYIHDWYTVFFDPDNSRICVDDERWTLEVWTGKKWREVDLYNPSLTYSNNATHLTVTRTFDCPEGLFNVTYIVWQGSRLKHDIVFKSRMSGDNQFRVTMKLTGIYHDKVEYSEGKETITSEKHIVSPYFFIGEDNNNLVLSEYLWSLGVTNETNGEWMATTLKDIVFNTHAKGCKADIIIGNYSLAESESLLIDPATDTWQVGASSDDAKEDVGGVMYLTAIEIRLTADTVWGGWRWTGVNLPSGCTVDSAYFKPYLPNDSDDYFTGKRIYGEDGNNPSTFTTDDYDISSRTRTTAYYDLTGGAQCPPIGWKTSGDIKAVIQEIVDDNGGSGDALILIIDSTTTDDLDITAWDGDSALASKLEVTWTVGGEEYERSASQSLSVSLTASRLFEITRPVTQAIGIGLATSRVMEAFRTVTQAVGVILDATRGIDITRQVTQSIGVSIVGDRLIEVSKAVTQAITIALQGIGLKIAEYERTASLTLTLVTSVMGLFGVTTGLGLAMIALVFALFAVVIGLVAKK